MWSETESNRMGAELSYSVVDAMKAENRDIDTESVDDKG